MVRPIDPNGTGRPNIVIPTIRDSSFFYNFLQAWKEEFKGCHLIVIEDRPVKILDGILFNVSQGSFTYELYSWADIDEDLGSISWIIPRQTDCVRNYGYLMAYRNKPLFILTLDDDLEPDCKNYIQQHYNILFTPSQNYLNYFSTMIEDNPRGNLVTEGYGHEVVVSHSTWTNVPDYSAKQHIGKAKSGVYATPNDFYSGIIPKGCYYSMCGMALAWKPWFTRYMYFPLMGKTNGYPIDRCGDIWAGYYSKYVADNLSVLHHTGEPMVRHNKASNVWNNLIKEENEDKMGKEFISTIIEGNKPKIEEEYFDKLDKAYKIWAELINNEDNYC